MAATRGLGKWSWTCEEERKCCSRISERCTYVATRRTFDRRACCVDEATPTKEKVPPTRRVGPSSGDMIPRDLDQREGCRDVSKHILSHPSRPNKIVDWPSSGNVNTPLENLQLAEAGRTTPAVLEIASLLPSGATHNRRCLATDLGAGVWDCATRSFTWLSVNLEGLPLEGMSGEPVF